MVFDNSLLEQLLDTLDLSVCLYDAQGRLVLCNNQFKARFIGAGRPFEGLSYIEIAGSDHRRISLIEEALSSMARQDGIRADSEGNAYRIVARPLTGSGGEPLILEIISTQPAMDKAFNPGKTFFEPTDLVFSDAAMKGILETVHRISNFDSTILITGESGTGKSMLARYIHQTSKRAAKPFVTIDCATIPENLIESELFGYVSGAFTGASQKGKPGMVEQADGGTLFLDEIGLLPLSLQAKFLQLIQEKTYMPIGSLKSKSVNIRIISATNMDLKAETMQNRFREDLYYRLRVIEFSMPPLRARRDAIEPLIDFFLQQFNLKYNISKSITDKAKDMLKHHVWNGNIRELQYVMERIIATSPSNQITAGDIPPLTDENRAADNSGDNEAVDFENEVELFESRLLKTAFDRCKSSYKVAEALGLSQSKASRLLRKYNIR